MTYRGHIENGNVVFDSATRPPDGSIVEVALVSPVTALARDSEPTLGEKLLKFAGKATGLPSDLAEQHDHYLYGTAKQ